MAAGRNVVGVEAASVVVDLQDHAGVLLAQAEAAGGGGGVPADVGQRLAGELDDVAGVCGQRGGGLRVDLGDRDHAAAPGELLDQAAQGPLELAVGQDPRAQAEDVVAQVADDPVELGDRVLDAGGELGVAGERGRGLQAQADREQCLDGAVVELLGDPFAVLDDHQAVQLAA